MHPTLKRLLFVLLTSASCLLSVDHMISREACLAAVLLNTLLLALALFALPAGARPNRSHRPTHIFRVD